LSVTKKPKYSWDW